MNRRRLIQTLILLVGLTGIALAVWKSVEDTQGQVLPSAAALVAGGLLAQIGILASARAWVSLFSDLLTERSNRALLRGTFYLSQLTKYLPVGGVAQAASQLGLAPTAGIPLKRAAVAYPVSAVCAVVAGLTLSTGLVFETGLPGWVRVLCVCGLLSVVLLRRGLMARFLTFARRVYHRVPSAELLPTQRDILMFYVWALVTVAASAAAYSLMLGSLHTGANLLTIFCGFALSWVIGFLAVPIPAGVGVREALLVALILGVGTGSVLAASLALRLLTIGTEVMAFLVNKLVVRHHQRRLAGLAGGGPSATAAADAPITTSEPTPGHAVGGA